MPRRGENIRKRKDGRWEGRYPALNADGGSVSRSVYGKTYMEVKGKLAERRALSAAAESIERSQTGRGAEDSGILFRTVAAAWLTNVEQSKKRSTYVKYNSIYHKYLEPLSGLSVQDVTEDAVGSILPVRNQLSVSCQKSIYCVLNQILTYGNERFHSSAAGITRPKSHIIAKPVQVLNRTEQARLLEILYDNMDLSKFGILLCLSTGLRLGEICGLKWSDIDLKEKVLYVRRTVQRIAWKNAGTKTILMEDEPKSICSRREIPIPDHVAQLMRNLQTEGEYVISGNRPTEPRTYQKRLQKYFWQAGIQEKNFHTLRHSFATNCIEAGADVKSVSEILGHSSVTITLNRYVHPNLNIKRQYLNNLTAIYGQYVGREKVRKEVI